MPRPNKYYSLTRPKLRQSWNKHNLYNMFKLAGREPLLINQRTFFQQKWAAKSKTRAYHGEHIPEKKWNRLFSRRLMSAVDMSPEYLAAHDGSEQAAGRGSGLTTTTVSADKYSRVHGFNPDAQFETVKPKNVDPNKKLEEPLKDMTPYMHMTYAPLERRLDTAVFRALFASSIRQARQFVVHGGVKVNGKKMVHPAYQLNPGDMFQVDVEKVLYGTGEQKEKSTTKAIQGSMAARQRREEGLMKQVLAKQAEGGGEEKASEGEAAAAEGEAAEGETAEGGAAGEEAAAAETAEASLTPEEAWKLNNKKLKFLLKDIRSLLSREGKDLSAKDKKRLRLFRTSAHRFLSQGSSANLDAKELMSSLELQMKSHEMMRETFEKFNVAEQEGGQTETEAGEEKPKYNREKEIAKGFQELNDEQREKALRIMGDSQMTPGEMKKLGRLLKFDEENPVDDSKPYATPWRPRQFMPAFAFIPRYLEVNPNICAAVYLRHPVARKGLAEVPTPFGHLTSQLAHNWYLRRG